MAFPIPKREPTKVLLTESNIEVTVKPHTGRHATESMRMAAETKKDQQICQLYIAGVSYVDPTDGLIKNMLLDELEQLPATDMYLLLGAAYGTAAGNELSPEK